MTDNSNQRGQSGGGFNMPRVSGTRDNSGGSFNTGSRNMNIQSNSLLPEDYLKGGYFEYAGGEIKVKKLKKELILGLGQRISRDIANARTDLKTAQLRKFYDYCRNISENLKHWNGDFNSVETDILKLMCFASDAKTKGKIPDIFYEFIKRNVEAIKDADDFKKGFMEHFQAIVAYYPKKN